MRGRLRPLLLPVSLLGLTALLLSTSAALADKPSHRHLAPVRHARPRLSGTAQVGHVLRVSPGRWSRASRFVDLWQRCNRHGARCAVIRRRKTRGTKPRARTYRLTSRDLGHTIRVTVIAINRWGRRSATSAASRVVRPSGSGTAPTPTPTPTPTPILSNGAAGLHVVGNKLVDANGNVVRLHGVDRSGSEYACIQNAGIFDGGGTNDDSQIPLIKAWHANEILIGLNEDCWLGINGAPAAYSGQNYINAIKHEVASAEGRPSTHNRHVLDGPWFDEGDRPVVDARLRPLRRVRS